MTSAPRWKTLVVLDPTGELWRFSKDVSRSRRMPHEIPLPGLSWENLRVQSEPDLPSPSTVPLVGEAACG